MLKIRNKKNWGKNCENVEGWKQSGVENFELKGILDSDINIDAPLNMDPNRSWNVQFFRSITDDSARFLDETRTSCVSLVKVLDITANPIFLRFHI